ncbi:MAG: SpoIIE family protein phosphatase [Verrucomicrobiia bacterium]|jgi:sigma-B regulation protein RsbU (phosphoserine phosphatase)
MSAEEQLATYKALVDAARCFERERDRHSLIDEILNRSREVISAEASSILLPDKKTGELILYSTHEKFAKLDQPLRIPQGSGVSGYVFKSRKVVNLRDAQTDPRYYDEVEKETDMEIHAMLSIPLMDDDECLGVMQAVNPIGRDCFSSDCEEIFEGFGGLIVNALMRLENEKREAEHAKAKQELTMAREIQDSFLPPTSQVFPFCRAHLKYFPARTVSGDFYFLHQLNENRLLMGLGDVSGKGIPAALTMARVTATVKALTNQVSANLGEWVVLLNQQLCEELSAGRFIGMTILLADCEKSTLQICAAGQYAPFHCNGQEWSIPEIQTHLPLGVNPSTVYHAQEFPLEPGGFWFMFSDGITEARNAAGDELNIERLLAEMPARETGARTIESAIRVWKEFVGDAPQHDDAALALLDWRGPPPPAELKITCQPATLCQCRDFIERWARHTGFDDIIAGQIVMACDEAASNIFRHAYSEKPGPMCFQAETSETELVIRIIDQAGRIDPEQIKGRDLCELRPGGLGTQVICSVFDRAHYDSGEIGTTLTLGKKLPE